MNTLGDKFPQEIEIAKEKLQNYIDIGAPGMFAVSWIKPLIAEAEKAWQEQDTVAMLRLYPALQNISW